LAGIIGGAAMLLFSMIVFLLAGAGGFTRPTQLIGAVFRQSWGDLSGFSLVPFVLGLFMHGCMSIAVGLVLGWMATAMRWKSAAVLAGSVVVSMIVWAVAQYTIVPMVDPVMARNFPAWIFALAHATFGVAAGGYLAHELLLARPHAHEHEFQLPTAARDQ